MSNPSIQSFESRNFNAAFLTVNPTSLPNQQTNPNPNPNPNPLKYQGLNHE